MYINLNYDYDASSMSEKMIFTYDNYELERGDIIKLNQDKILKFVNWENLPEMINCNVILQFESPIKVKFIFYNTTFKMPEKVYLEPILNKNLIERSENYWWFWLEFDVSLNYDWIKINFQLDY